MMPQLLTSTNQVKQRLLADVQKEARDARRRCELLIRMK